MEDREVSIVQPNGNIDKVFLITYLLSEDGLRQYIVYSKDEAYGVDQDKIIYISRLNNVDRVLSVTEIDDDVEWNEVQKLLRKIANAK